MDRRVEHSPVFPDVTCEPISYLDPWYATYDERLRALVRRQRHVAYVYEEADSSTFRYRVFNMIEAFDDAPDLDVSASWFTREDLRGDLRFVDRADALVICRTRYDQNVARLLTRARARGMPVLFDIDDLVFNTDYVHMVTQTLDRVGMDDWEWDAWAAQAARLGMTLKNCDAVMTTTAPLARRVREFAPAQRVIVVPNFLNRRQVEISASLLARKRSGGYRRDSPTVIGYFSGSPTHNRDLLIASPALAGLMERRPDVTLRIVGFIDLNEVLRPFRDRVELVAFQDFVNLQRLIAEVEINIVPLQSNAFTDCKSELKYFEAAVVGVVTIASPTSPLAGVITEGANGYLAGAHEWESKLDGLIEMIDQDPAAYVEVAEKAVADALRLYGWDRQASALEAAIFAETCVPHPF
jgi:glycosyltransferase involved in cell wall biosynthesis